jgi:hypothetical protein
MQQGHELKNDDGIDLDYKLSPILEYYSQPIVNMTSVKIKSFLGLFGVADKSAIPPFCKGFENENVLRNEFLV